MSVTVATTNTSRGHHFSPANGRVFCAQPIGDSHESVPSPMSPTARDDERRTEDRARDAVHDPRVLADLRGHQRDAGEEQPDHNERDAEYRRSRCGQTFGQHDQRRTDTHRHVHADDDEHGCGRRRVRSDRQRPQQLQPTGLFLASA